MPRYEIISIISARGVLHRQQPCKARSVQARKKQHLYYNTYLLYLSAIKLHDFALNVRLRMSAMDWKEHDRLINGPCRACRACRACRTCRPQLCEARDHGACRTAGASSRYQRLIAVRLDVYIQLHVYVVLLRS